jgi:Rrf2 family transcriptional regulator, iron-sulfur cluster assembly transcription factor
MQLTMSREYAIRAMVYLAELPPGAVAQIADISREWEIPETFLRKISTRLVKSGLITSRRGVGGGIQLARSADQMTLLDVIEAVEGKIYANECLMENRECPRAAWCEVHTIWSEVQHSVRSILSSKSLKQVAHETALRRNGGPVLHLKNNHA